MKRIGSFLIAVALVVGMVGCGDVVDNGNGNGDGNGSGNGNGNGEVSYQLTISSTSGGSVVEPREGVHTYEEGTVVDLVAEPDAGYRFVNWTGDVGTIAKVDAASTTITINANYSITARFDEGPDSQVTLTTLNAGGGSVAVPGDGSFRYDAGTVVELVATPASGYVFINWTGDVDTVANANGAATTVTVNAELFIVANFRGEGFRLHCGGSLDPEGWWYYSLEYDAELDVKWHEALFIRTPERVVADRFTEEDRGAGIAGGGPDGWGRVRLMTEKVGGEARRVVVASWWNKLAFKAGVFEATQENVQALIYDSMELDGPSGEFNRFVVEAVEMSSDVIAGWTADWIDRDG